MRPVYILAGILALGIGIWGTMNSWSIERMLSFGAAESDSGGVKYRKNDSLRKADRL